MSRRTSDLGGPPAKQQRLDAKSEEPPASRGPRHELLSKGVRYPVVAYREGEPLAALQQVYDASTSDDKIVEVVISPDAMSTHTNRRVKSRQLWGDYIYTGDSDLVAALLHLGYYSQNHPHPPGQVLEFRVLLRLLPSLERYPSKARFLKSRSWCSPIQGCSFQVECCWLITRGGTVVELQPCLDEAPAPYPTVHSQYNRQTLMTRSTGRQVPKHNQDVSLQFNLCNEPWLKYSLSAIADRSTRPSLWTSSQLVDKVLYFETASTRYQVARTGEQVEGEQKKDMYLLSKCKQPLPLTIMRRQGVPLPADQVQTLEQSVGWEEFQWGVSSVVVRGKELAVRRIHFEPLCASAGSV